MRNKARSHLQIENDKVIVTRWDFAPGEETGHHRHGYDYIVIPLKDGHLEAVNGEGTKLGEMKTGQSYARPAGVEHNIINPGPGEMAFIEIEFKK